MATVIEEDAQRPSPRQRIMEWRRNEVLYAAECLRIKDKQGRITPLVYNKAQLYAQAKLDEQKRAIGKVRALVLKGRQQGLSTMIASRYYHQVSLFKGLGVYILTHEQKASENCFGMVDRFYKNSPVKPELGKSNAKEMNFVRLDSGYIVGTAGVKAGGRSRTIQLFHGSEVAFWPNDSDQFGGVVQSVPDMEGTEIILESTANGPRGEFYERWQKAEKNLSEYIAIFIPWFWQSEYTRRAPGDFSYYTEKQNEIETETEEDYATLYGLGRDQMYWRRVKIEEIGYVKFKQEYPATSDEAFQFTGHDSFIKPVDIVRARKNVCVGSGPLICGADPSRYGADSFCIAWRRGRKVEKVERRVQVETTAAAFWIKRVIDQDKPAKFFIDAGGGGAQIYDVVISFGSEYDEIMELINFGGEPEEPVLYLDTGEPRPGPKNRRAEMWMRSNDWLKQTGGADIPDESQIQSDACAPGYKYDITTQQLVLESKEAMRNRGALSPDAWDAICLTFASMVYDEVNETSSDSASRRRSKVAAKFRRPGAWMMR